MREIKFRAWDTEKQFMFTPTQVEITQGENFAKWDKWRPMAWRDELPEEGSGGIGRALGDECELMQYTGLKDKNGKDIYEGDIVRIFVPHDPEEKEYVSKVYELDGAFAVDMVGYDMYMDVHCIGWIPGGYELEVIGNIYESLDLIKN
ncbi:hypothetical protein IBT50_25385 [Bacillus sp. S70]|uniref:YopX family protein n=1 Tax=Bacillus TaxID=1386 RepID=UPI000B44C502|nr:MULTISPECIES: YopX family protein [Bacillus]MEC2865334.1 YopX family protein [Bacillus cereus]MBJ9983558.1 hypothetical protein [Bacillus sp. S29]MBK0104696.1 hypothetical protein [Bacillus sp. S70]MBK0110042.1 hypothetical protein [Bacillus sp. S73]MBK0138823.1 hypothetical protein [Bacillus sp. S72]